MENGEWWLDEVESLVGEGGTCLAYTTVGTTLDSTRVREISLTTRKAGSDNK